MPNRNDPLNNEQLKRNLNAIFHLLSIGIGAYEFLVAINKPSDNSRESVDTFAFFLSYSIAIVTLSLVGLSFNLFFRATSFASTRNNMNLSADFEDHTSRMLFGTEAAVSLVTVLSVTTNSLLKDSRTSYTLALITFLMGLFGTFLINPTRDNDHRPSTP